MQAWAYATFGRGANLFTALIINWNWWSAVSAVTVLSSATAVGCVSW